MKNLSLVTAALFLLVTWSGVTASAELLPGSSSASPGNLETLTVTVSSPSQNEFRITESSEGQRIELEGFGHLMLPGKPMLPSKNFLIALPPGAKARSVEVKGTGPTQLPGSYRIAPAPPIVPLVDPEQGREIIDRLQAEWKKNNESTYTSDQAYPAECGRLKTTGTLRKYSYASVSYCPFRYHPSSGKLYYYEKASITIEFDTPNQDSPEAIKIQQMKHDTAADDRAQRLFVNNRDVENIYRPETSPSHSKHQVPWRRYTYDYVIITHQMYVNAITSSDFLPWKESLGYQVLIVTIDDERITGQEGIDIAEKIRNFLREYYIQWGIEYVLFVGEHSVIPMRYCYPDPTNHLFDILDPWSGEVPTDYYYADLSLPDEDSWDLDGDGYYGEYEQDSPDFLPEVYVGRIPANSSRIPYTLNKLVSFEQDTGSWKNSALHAGAFWYYENEDYSGYPVYDGATCMDVMETEIMEGWTTSHYSEQAGLVPSIYNWPALTWDAFTSDWREGQYSIVNWGAHGSQTSVARKVWTWDDGDGVPESNEMAWDNFLSSWADLDDDYPSIFFSMSCLVGYPEPYEWPRLGIELLTQPSWGASVGSVGATRVAYGHLGWPESPGGCESMCYEFNRNMINGPDGPEKVGDALYNAKFYCIINCPMEHFADNWNNYIFNLYGDPSLVREGVE
jgi:hypothetical protein